MSGARQSQLLSAALRHVEDAAYLLPRSPDQSWHLAGFGPECVRKACLDEHWLDKALGHDLATAGDDVLELAGALDVRAARYRLTGVHSRYPLLAEWRVEARYERTGARTGSTAKQIVKQAANLTYELAAALWMDGRVDIWS